MPSKKGSWGVGEKKPWLNEMVESMALLREERWESEVVTSWRINTEEAGLVFGIKHGADLFFVVIKT